MPIDVAVSKRSEKLITKMECLRDHETVEGGQRRKEGARISNPKKTLPLRDGQQITYSFSTPFYKDFLDRILFAIHEEQPDLFGTNDPTPLLKAVYDFTQREGNYIGVDFDFLTR